MKPPKRDLEGVLICTCLRQTEAWTSPIMDGDAAALSEALTRALQPLVGTMSAVEQRISRLETQTSRGKAVSVDQTKASAVAARPMMQRSNSSAFKLGATSLNLKQNDTPDQVSKKEKEGCFPPPSPPP